VVGCGLELFVPGVDGPVYYGADLDGASIDACRALYPELAARLGTCRSAYELPVEGAFDVEFDAIVAKEVIEHLDDADRWVRGLAARLSPGGELLLRTPNYGRLSTLPAGGRGREHVDGLGALRPLAHVRRPRTPSARGRPGLRPRVHALFLGAWLSRTASFRRDHPEALHGEHAYGWAVRPQLATSISATTARGSRSRTTSSGRRPAGQAAPWVTVARRGGSRRGRR
jgi:SAM-dependent methyltransferase